MTATKKLATKEFINEDNKRMYKKNMKLYMQEKKQVQKILEEILDIEEFKDDFLDPKEKEEEEKLKQES